MLIMPLFLERQDQIGYFLSVPLIDSKLAYVSDISCFKVNFPSIVLFEFIFLIFLALKKKSYPLKIYYFRN